MSKAATKIADRLTSDNAALDHVKSDALDQDDFDRRRSLGRAAAPGTESEHSTHYECFDADEGWVGPVVPDHWSHDRTAKPTLATA